MVFWPHIYGAKEPNHLNPAIFDCDTILLAGFKDLEEVPSDLVILCSWILSGTLGRSPSWYGESLQPRL